jgi:hypothetical protein
VKKVSAQETRPPIAESDHTESIEAESGEFLAITAVGDTVSYEPEVISRSDFVHAYDDPLTAAPEV